MMMADYFFTGMEFLTTFLTNIIETNIIPYLSTVELWIAVFVILASLLLLYNSYKNREDAVTYNDEGRILSRRTRGESFIGVWSEEDVDMNLVQSSKNNLVFVEGLVPHDVGFDIVITYTVDGNSKTLTMSKCENRTIKQEKNVISQIQFQDDYVSIIITVSNGQELRLSTKVTTLLKKNDTAIISLEDATFIHAFGANGSSFKNLNQVLVFQNGFQSWAPSGPVQGTQSQEYAMFNLPYLNKFISAMMHNVDSTVWGRTDLLISEHFSAFTHADSDIAFVAGYLSSEIALGQICFEQKSRKIHCIQGCNGRTVDNKKALQLEDFILLKGRAQKALDKFASLCVEKVDLVPSDDAVSPVGWCSWYELYNDVKESDILRNVELLASHPELHMEFVQVDDGYQAAIGDWLTCNRKFPNGLKAIASHIKAHGFRAGIWVAPFLIGHSSTVFRDHPDWLVKQKRNGTSNIFHFNPNWHDDSYTYAVDLTHPGVQKWLKNVFVELKSYGFDYFKLDYLIAGIRDGIRYENNISRVEAYRIGMQIIRDAVGKDSFILACGAPLAPSLGFVDAMRVSNDVADRWSPNTLENIFACGEGVPCTKLALLSNCSRNFLHGIWWLNDPDCVVARSRNTGLNLLEVTAQLTLIGMTGGLVALSDDLTSIALDRLSLVQKIIPPSTSSRGLPLEPMRDRYPLTFCCKGEEDGDSTLIAFMNWSSRPIMRAMAVDLSLIFTRTCPMDKPWTSSHYLFDFWRGDLLEHSTLKIESHAARAIIATEATMYPTLVGNSFSLVGMTDGRINYDWDEKSRKFVVRGHNLSVMNGALWVTLPHRNKCFIDFALMSPNCSATIVEEVETPEHKTLKISVSISQVAPWQVSIYVAPPGDSTDITKSKIPTPSKRRESIDASGNFEGLKTESLKLRKRRKSKY